ncbi:TIGR03118 family protein [Rickettsiales bacterium]|nr:TIGR03118 family protein [Rickettsiales bacterium]
MSMRKLLLTTAIITSISSSSFAGESENKYIQTNLVANKAKYKAEITDEKLVNGWGIATRPAGAGGHFWVEGKDISFQYIGDVKNSPDPKLRKLHQEDVPYIKIPTGSEDAFTTGVVFVNTKDNFVITQKMDGIEPIVAPSKFIFASDGGVISAWTERKNSDGSFDRPVDAVTVIDESNDGVQFFGLAINADYNRIYAANFGENPDIKVYDGNFKAEKVKFDMPFDDNKNGKVDPGEYAPFNIQALTTPEGKNHIFVAYAKTQTCPEEEVESGACAEGEMFVGEEDTSVPGNGRVAEFTQDGKLVNILNDGGKLSAPWGFSFAPSDFGALSGKLLVTNFGDGTIAAYDYKTKKFVDYLHDENGKAIEIKQIWGIAFGNGASLGDKNALYFAAGPDDEADGLFGSLRPANY